MPKSRKSPIEAFLALPESEKQRIERELDNETLKQSLARSRPLNDRERRQWRRFKVKLGRPRIGEGTKTISLTVEKGLLQQADAYAREHGISRAKLVAQGLRVILGPAA